MFRAQCACHRVLLAALLFLWASAVPAATLESLKQTYERSAEKIAAEQRTRENSLSAAYGAALEGAAAALRRSGKLNAFLVVEEEIKRFKADPSVPTGASRSEEVTAARSAYEEAAGRAERACAERRKKLLKQYIASLQTLQRRHMQADKIDEAKAVGVVKSTAEFELAEIEALLSGAPSPTQTSPREAPKPEKPAASNEREGQQDKAGVKKGASAAVSAKEPALLLQKRKVYQAELKRARQRYLSELESTLRRYAHRSDSQSIATARAFQKEVETLRAAIAEAALTARGRLVILKATFGSVERQKDVTKVVREHIVDNEVDINTGKSLVFLFGDPHFGATKGLTVEYQVGNNEPKTAQFKEKDRVRIRP